MLMLFTLEEALAGVLPRVGRGETLTPRQARRLAELLAVTPAHQPYEAGASALYDFPGLALLRANAILAGKPDRDERPTFTARVLTFRENQRILRRATEKDWPFALVFDEVDVPGDVVRVRTAKERRVTVTQPWSALGEVLGASDPRCKRAAVTLSWRTVTKGLEEAATTFRAERETLWAAHRQVPVDQVERIVRQQERLATVGA
jgi:hypothetical protein